MTETTPPAPPAILVEALGKTFASGDGSRPVDVLRGITCSVPAGALTAIVGPSGCGKSTLLFCLAGLERPTAGRVTVLGHDMSRMRPRAVARLYRERIGFVFQTYNLVPSLSARENVVLPRRLAGAPVDLAAADALLTEMGLAGQRRVGAGRLSSGEQQRVALARILAMDPALVFADEPTGALDTHTTAMVLGRLRALADGARTVVMVTHDLDAASLADQVLVMRDGLLTATLIRPAPDRIRQAMATRSPLLAGCPGTTVSAPGSAA